MSVVTASVAVHPKQATKMKITWGLLIAAALADAKLPAYKVLPLDDSVQESGPSLYFKDGSIVHNAKLPGENSPVPLLQSKLMY